MAQGNPGVNSLVVGGIVVGLSQLAAYVAGEVNPSIGENAHLAADVLGTTGAITYAAQQMDRVPNRMARSWAKVGLATILGGVVGHAVGDYQGGINMVQSMGETLNHATNSQSSEYGAMFAGGLTALMGLGKKL